jgi:SH3 domain protein
MTPRLSLLPAILLVAVLALPTAGFAQARYVTDQGDFYLRSGPSNGHRITKQVDAGTSVTVLETDEAAGYTRVRLADNTVGWILSRYLTGQPSARDQLSQAKAQVERMEAQVREMEVALAGTREENTSLSGSRNSLEAEVTRLSGELERIRAVSSGALRLEATNRQLQEQLAQANQRADTLESKNRMLSDSSRRDWFLAGAGTIVLGLILGLILPRLRFRRKSKWGDL